MVISTAQAAEMLQKQSQLFATVFEHGSLSVEIYRPNGVDLQQPHDRDEIYVVISGSGEFVLEGKVSAFEPGTFIFVPAGAEHRFERFTEDFSTWVLFYGPIGGERSI